MEMRSCKGRMDWRFPLPATHAGILMGNGRFGVAVWGDRRLCLTVNRADFWDHRNSKSITAQMNYENLRGRWLAGDLVGMGHLVPRDPPEIQIEAPSGLPMGRIELDLHVESACLHMDEGVLHLAEKGGGTSLRLFVAADQPLLLIETARTDIEIIRKPAWDFLGEYFASVGHRPPEMFERGVITGWVQELPADPCLCLACGRLPDGLAITAVYGETPDEAKANAEAALREVRDKGIDGSIRSTRRWWHDYWEKIPRVDLPSQDAEDVYYYGLFKLAGMTKEYPALLQGPWVEEYQMPDCCNDLHFNVNVQMCYWPAYAANCSELLRALFDKLKVWEPKLRRNAELLFGIKDGLFLPMSVTDDGEWIGNYWASFTDFAVTGWAAHLMWLHYRYSMDTEFLRATAYPFMKGSMRVFEAVLEEKDGRMVLPMGTSPEYNWNMLEAAGKDASFQLACIHFLLESLITAADLLGIDAEDAEAWRRLKEKVPTHSTFTDPEPYPLGAQRGPGSELAELPRIALFEGQDLEYSHRHHSHLAALHPFDTLDPEDEEFAGLLRSTIRRLVEIGPGNWIAFSFVWASIIHSRVKDGEAAYLNYTLWHELFTNEHRGAVELSRFPGLTTWTSGQSEGPMQMDALMGAVNAIQEMLLHTVRGRLTVFPAIPRVWQKAAAFERMRAEGAFLVSAEMKDGRIIRVEIFSEKGAALRLANNIAEDIVVSRDGKEDRIKTELLTLDTTSGETIIIRPAATE